jgi:hypothetical protein
MVQGLGFRVKDLGDKVQGSGWVWRKWFRVKGLDFELWALSFRL